VAITNSDGSIVLTTSVDQSGLKKGMSTMKSGVSSLTSSFAKLASAIGVAFSVGALIKFSKESSDLATASEAKPIFRNLATMAAYIAEHRTK
jgi:hypothetical protein